MRPHFIKSSTILELLVSMVILSILVIIFAAIELFSHTHVLTVDRRARVQNDLAYILEHSSKQIAKAIGNTKINNYEIIKTDTVEGSDGAAIEFYIDVDGNGKRDDDSSTPWRGYRFRSATAGSDSYQFWYCPQCSDSTCKVCTPAWGYKDNTLGERVTNATYTYNYDNNYVDIEISGCWDKANEAIFGNCGSSDKNPSASLTARIKMPSVSTR